MLVAILAWQAGSTSQAIRRMTSETITHESITHESITHESITHESITHSAEETIALGRTLASELSPPLIVLLQGDLGAGKTTLVKGIAEGFGAACAEDVTSPTFTLIHEYHSPRVHLYHIDLYRIETERELESLALDDLLAADSILLIEWGEKFPRLLRDRDIQITLETVGETGRRIQRTSR